MRLLRIEVRRKDSKEREEFFVRDIVGIFQEEGGTEIKFVGVNKKEISKILLGKFVEVFIYNDIEVLDEIRLGLGLGLGLG